jgi:hypothetical protein
VKHGSALGHETTLAERLGERRVDAVAALFRDTGGDRVGSLDWPDTTPMVTTEIPAPEGASTALRYSPVIAVMLPFLIALTT